MLLIQGEAAGTTLTGTLYGPGERPPRYTGAPDEDAPFTWVCEEVYEVADGGHRQRLGDREIQVAFNDPLPQGYESRSAAIEGATAHLRTQFAKLGIDPAAVAVKLRPGDAE